MSQQTGFIHSVYFWVREDGQKEDGQKIAEGCKKHLPGIPSVLRLEVGAPAGTPRPIVDNSYAVALLVEFADQAGHDLYQDHPDHHRFVDECKSLWSRVQIYDSIPL